MPRHEREHAVNLAGHDGDLGTLAVEIGRMRYDAQAFLLRALADELARQAAADRKRGRPKLAASLDMAAAVVDRSAESVHAAWRHCRRHVSHELGMRPEIPWSDRDR